MKFWEVKNKAQEEGELILYGDIVDSKPWWSEGQFITPQEFLNDIALLKNKSKITVRINSRGGDVFTAQAIHDQLKQLSCYKEVIIEGLAASAATIITCAGDKVLIGPGAAFMIHNPSITVWDSFQASDLDQLKNMLESVKTGIIENYMAKTGMSNEELSQLMDNESWLTGRKAVEMGFCDELLEGFSISNKIINNRMVLVNNIAHDLSGFKNMPTFEAVQNKTKPKEERSDKLMTVEDLKKEYPKLVAQIEAAAEDKGAQEERQRIKDIEEIATSISAELVAKAKFDEPMDAKTLAFNAVKQDKRLAADFSNNLEMDVEDAGTNEVKGDAEPSKNKGKGLLLCLNNDKRRVK